MSRRLLSLLAIAVAIVATMSFFGSPGASTPTHAAGVGPNINYRFGAPASLVATNIILVGVPFTVLVEATTPAADEWSGYNAGLLYDPLKNTVKANDVSVASGFWTADGCSPPNDVFPAVPPAPPGDFISQISCSATAGLVSPNPTGVFVRYDVVNILAGGAGLHLITPLEAGILAGSLSTYTINDADSSIQSNSYSCSAAISLPGLGCQVIAPSPFKTIVELSIKPPSTLVVTKVPDIAAVVASQADGFTITVTNTSGAGFDSPVVMLSDTFPAAYIPTNASEAAVYAGGALGPASCAIAGQVLGPCGPITLPPGGSVSVHVAITTDPGAGGTSPVNTACTTRVDGGDPTPVCGTGAIQIIPPAVDWQKTPTSGNLWLCTHAAAPAVDQCALQSVGQQTNTFSFDEIMFNQGDPNGMGAFSFDVHYDPTQYMQPVVDLSPAIALFADPDEHGATCANNLTESPGDLCRTLTCDFSILLDGILHIGCASTGAFGTGPAWIGSQVMAHVTLTPLSALVEAIRPNKENGDISTVKDDQVKVKNSCGQPLNDGTIQPIPGQPECQGVPLLCVGASGQLTCKNPNGGESTQTIRRLEGDVNKDCSVNVLDMQFEASRFGVSIGSLLYNVFFDVNSPLQHGDGEIDINDIQFVYGRFGSECSNPIPPQPAQPNPN